MATHNSDPRIALAKALNTSVAMFSERLEDRLAPVDKLIDLEDSKKHALKTAKAEADKKYDTKAAEEFLGKRQGWRKAALKCIKILEAGSTEDAAANFRQLFERAKDKGYFVPDLLDAGVFGTGTIDPDQPAFDSTTTGKRQGGAKAEPRPVAAKEATPPAREIPSLSMEDALKGYEEAERLHGGKRGPRHKDLKLAIAALEEAKARAAAEGTITSDQADAVTEAETNAAAADGGEAETGTTEASNVVSFAEQQRRANALGDAMTRGMSQPSAPPADEAPETTEAAAPAVTEKPKRASRSKKKDTPAEPAPAPAPSKATSGPSAPPADDEDEDGGEPDFPPVPGETLERRSSSFTSA